MHATTSDEWFDAFIERLEADPRRVRRAVSEQYRPLPPRVLNNRVYDAHTENLRVQLREAANG